MRRRRVRMRASLGYSSERATMRPLGRLVTRTVGLRLREHYRNSLRAVGAANEGNAVGRRPEPVWGTQATAALT